MADLILALDLPTGDDARRLVDRIPELTWVKLGPVLMNRAGGGVDLVREMVDRGLRVFLDQKWHDIPNTVRGAAEAARGLGVRMATVHALGGAPMLAAAAEGAGESGDGGGLGIVAVTVLTSHDASSYGDAVGGLRADLRQEVRRLATLAMGAGVRGLVCSPEEAADVRDVVGEGKWVVVPGVRRPGDAAGDQSRTAAPRDVVRRGASHLVVGRPVTAAADPRAEYLDFLEAVSC